MAEKNIPQGETTKDFIFSFLENNPSSTYGHFIQSTQRTDICKSDYYYMRLQYHGQKGTKPDKTFKKIDRDLIAKFISMNPSASFKEFCKETQYKCHASSFYKFRRKFLEEKTGTKKKVPISTASNRHHSDPINYELLEEYIKNNPDATCTQYINDTGDSISGSSYCTFKNFYTLLRQEDPGILMLINTPLMSRKSFKEETGKVIAESTYRRFQKLAIRYARKKDEDFRKALRPDLPVVTHDTVDKSEKTAKNKYAQLFLVPAKNIPGSTKSVLRQIIKNINGVKNLNLEMVEILEPEHFLEIREKIFFK